MCCDEKMYGMNKEIRRELKVISAKVKVAEIVKVKIPTPMYPKSVALPNDSELDYPRSRYN